MEKRDWRQQAMDGDLVSWKAEVDTKIGCMRVELKIFKSIVVGLVDAISVHYAITRKRQIKTEPGVGPSLKRTRSNTIDLSSDQEEDIILPVFPTNTNNSDTTTSSKVHKEKRSKQKHDLSSKQTTNELLNPIVSEEPSNDKKGKKKKKHHQDHQEHQSQAKESQEIHTAAELSKGQINQQISPKPTSEKESILEKSPDHIVKDIVEELNLEHQHSELERTPSPPAFNINTSPPKPITSPQKTILEVPSPASLSPKAKPNAETSDIGIPNVTFGQMNLQDNPSIELAKDVTLDDTQQIPLEPPLNNVQGDETTHQHQEVPTMAHEVHEEEHSTTNDPPNDTGAKGEVNSENNQGSASSSSGYGKTAQTGDSVEDEDGSVSKPPHNISIPSEILKGMNLLSEDGGVENPNVGGGKNPNLGTVCGPPDPEEAKSCGSDTIGLDMAEVCGIWFRFSILRIFDHLTIMYPGGYTAAITNLSPRATESDVHNFFGYCGVIERVDVIRSSDYESIAYVTFKDAYALDTALLLNSLMQMENILWT
ncbi:unnamed protein product [Trifolium pratense]|uniref:Uncharacterized protein n=1 Tax=Trifolium pratense TaxID=57577 RepID=A0ACB0L551_TRIPR|nr:unnamed protein product [Trifolium pratense]